MTPNPIPEPSDELVLRVARAIAEHITLEVWDGKSAPASAENFDADLGRKLAYDDAVKQIWPLMGYELRERLYKTQANG